MKRTNLLRNITLGMVLSGFACSSCTDFDELNTDPTRMEKVNPGTLLDPILYDMGTYNWNRYYDYTFPLMQCLVSNNGTSRGRMVEHDRLPGRRNMEHLLQMDQQCQRNPTAQCPTGFPRTELRGCIPHLAKLDVRHIGRCFR